ncbi:hypothetical protein ABI_24480 [Asticcacaulis biprosthecium C19]|uniref:Uncharacterized protein n=1 Tax=Asticcacaulis biprosthecium C19 TaxID=715226 RepID=F4QNX7_9CAUL|nr:hypothetical protein ABI_24480 [Asticcacaulis biprosthecium C19]
MIFHRTLADPHIDRDVLVGLPGQDQRQDIALTLRQPRYPRRHRPVLCLAGVELPRSFDRGIDAVHQAPPRHWLFQEIRRAGLHGVDRHGDIAVAGDHHHRHGMAAAADPLQHIQPAHPRQPRVQQ